MIYLLLLTTSFFGEQGKASLSERNGCRPLLGVP
jgi:hypothetical protein